MTKLNELRKALKPLGFKLKTQTLSFGRVATFIHAETSQELSFNVFSPQLLERWNPLFKLLEGKTSELEAIKEEEDLKQRSLNEMRLKILKNKY